MYHLFIEKPREFIDIFRNSLFSNAPIRFAIIHARALSPMTANAGKCVFFHVRKILNKGEKLTPERVRRF